MIMRIIKSSLIVTSFIALSACTKPTKDYDSSAACLDQGMHPGTTAFDNCMKEEKASRALEQQRQEYEDQQWQRDYWRNQRSMY